MKLLLATAFAAFATSAFSQWTSVQYDGNQLTDISRVYINPAGKVIIIGNGGGASTTPDKLPKGFLASWGITNTARAPEQQGDAKVDELDRAIRSGVFREVDGIVYDSRKAESGWVSFHSAKVIQVLADGSILDSDPDPLRVTGIFVRGLTTVADTDTLSFSAKLTGNYSYINKVGGDRTIRAYDIGKPCTRSGIPEEVLSGKQAFARSSNLNGPALNVYETLPEADQLIGNGSGFFISEDGYLVTNFHVVRNARRVKVKNSQRTYDAHVVTTNRLYDLALLKVDGAFSALQISTNEATLGESVFTIGFPNLALQGAEPKFTDGKISSLQGMRDDPFQYQISVPVQPGNSGGPLVDSSGRVKGVVVARLADLNALRLTGTLPQNVNYAVKGKYLREFLSATPELRQPQLTVSQAKAAPVADAQNAVAIILVY